MNIIFISGLCSCRGGLFLIERGICFDYLGKGVFDFTGGGGGWGDILIETSLVPYFMY